jgi:hypothetical protein
MGVLGNFDVSHMRILQATETVLDKLATPEISERLVRAERKQNALA